MCNNLKKILFVQGGGNFQRESFADIFRKRGFEIEIENSVNNAMSKLVLSNGKINYDLVITGINFENEFDGFEFLKKIKKIKYNIPVVALTAYSSNSPHPIGGNYGLHWEMLGGADFINKGESNESLVQKIQKLIRI